MPTMKLVCKNCGKKFNVEKEIAPYIKGLNHYCSLKCAPFDLAEIKAAREA
jgi:hypothetical protein